MSTLHAIDTKIGHLQSSLRPGSLSTKLMLFVHHLPRCNCLADWNLLCFHIPCSRLSCLCFSDISFLAITPFFWVILGSGHPRLNGPQNFDSTTTSFNLSSQHQNRPFNRIKFPNFRHIGSIGTSFVWCTCKTLILHRVLLRLELEDIVNSPDMVPYWNLTQ